MKIMQVTFIASVLLASSITSTVSADEPIRVLYLTKSSGFEHSVVKRENGKLGFSEKIMVEIGRENNMLVVPTKDAGLINETVLKEFDVVQFYTTGDLTKAGKDMGTPMSPEGREALINWVKNGGGFAGMHTSADTFHGWEPYTKLVGGEFATHGKQEKVRMEVKSHPITNHIGDTWELLDEWYIFKNVTHTFTPLIMLDTQSFEQEMYKKLDPYAITWIEEYGDGRVFCTGLGHREDVWTNPKFQKMLIKGIKWSAKQL